MRKDYLQGEDIETIYLGGGTPSQLEKEDFEQLFETIFRIYPVNDQAEITLEANPDDLTPEYLKNAQPTTVQPPQHGDTDIQ